MFGRSGLSCICDSGSPEAGGPGLRATAWSACLLRPPPSFCVPRSFRGVPPPARQASRFRTWVPSLGVLPRGNRGSTAITRRVSWSVRRSFQSFPARLHIASSSLKARRSDSQLISEYRRRVPGGGTQGDSAGRSPRTVVKATAGLSLGGFCDQHSPANRLTRLKRVLRR